MLGLSHVPIDLFQEALEIKKDHAGAMLGLALVAADDFENKAVELANEALKIDPKLLEAQELLARLALEDNDPEVAVSALESWRNTEVRDSAQDWHVASNARGT